jgi:hypothetical protein
MSGKPSGKQVPIDFSQSDIDQLAAGRRPAAVSRRLKAARVPGRRIAAGGDKRAPAPVKRGDLAALRAGRPSPAIRKRLFRESSARADVVASGQAVSDTHKAYPTQKLGAKKK